jgi:hypothetical protein
MNIYLKNAIDVLEPLATTDKEIARAYLSLKALTIQGGVLDFLANPFIRSAIGILEMMQGNPKIKQALSLLQEAGKEEEEAKKKKKKKR